MTKNNHLRPARPGDILWSLSGQYWVARITLCAPDPHPTVGVLEYPHPVRIRLGMHLEADPRNGYILACLQDPNRCTMGEMRGPHWGSPGEDSRAGVWVWRERLKYLRGTAIAPLVLEGSRVLTRALGDVAKTIDAHQSSVDRYRAMVEAANAQWMIPDYQSSSSDKVE